VTSDWLDDLLTSINEQLQSHGLMIKGATGAVIDATLIESAARPKKTITLEVDAEGKAVQFEDGSQPGISCTEEHSADPDSRAQSCIARTRTNRYRRASYFGTVKVNAQVLLKSICMNLKKAANKIFVDQPLRGAIRPNVA